MIVFISTSEANLSDIIESNLLLNLLRYAKMYENSVQLAKLYTYS